MLESRVADPVSLKKTRFRIFVDDGPDLEQMVLLFFLLSIQNSLKPEIQHACMARRKKAPPLVARPVRHYHPLSPFSPGRFKKVLLIIGPAFTYPPPPPSDLATIGGSFLRLPFLKNRIRKFSGAGEYFAYFPLFLTTSLSPKKIIQQ